MPTAIPNEKVISPISTDILSFKSLLDLALEFVNSRETLRTLKQKKNKQLIGSFMPNVELVCAAGGIPTYPVRMKPFGDQRFLSFLNFGKTLFGNKLLTGIVQRVAKFDNTQSLEKFMQSIIETIFEQWNSSYQMGLELGVPTDECYGIKVLTGMWAEKGKNLSSTIFASIRCSAFEKLYESMASYSPAPGIFIDVPPAKTDAAHEVAVAEVQKAAARLEQITGNTITNNSLRQVAMVTNECKDLSWRLISLALGDYYPFHPVTMASFLSLIEISFQDYLSNPTRFCELLRNIVREFGMAVQKRENVIDVSKYSKILFTSRFGGWDRAVEDYVVESHGRIIYADWFLYGFMDRIPTNGDMFDNYASYLQTNSQGFCPDNEILIDKIVKFVADNKIDAVIYNQLFGCHSLSTGYTWMRNKLRPLEVPSTMVSFNNVGENREQLKTRVVALLEILH